MSSIEDLEEKAMRITEDLQWYRVRVAENKARLAYHPHANLMTITDNELTVRRLERELGCVADLLTKAWKKKED